MTRQADDSPSIEVKILGKPYHFACPKEEREALSTSAHYLDQKMREIRASGSVLGADKIAVMAALNITHELTQAQTDTQILDEDQQIQLERIHNKLDLALAKFAK